MNNPLAEKIQPVNLSPQPVDASMAAANPVEPVQPAPVEPVASDTVAPTAATEQPGPTVEAPALGSEPTVELRRMTESLFAIHTRLSQLEQVVGMATEQVMKILPNQVRNLGGRINDIAISISEARYQGVLLNLLMIHDLVEQVLRSTATEPALPAEADHRRNYQVLHTQLRQVLAANGLSEISTDGPFDPKWHRAMQRVPSTDATQVGRVKEMIRPGFRTENAVLRYAEVVVWQEAVKPEVVVPNPITPAGETAP